MHNKPIFSAGGYTTLLERFIEKGYKLLPFRDALSYKEKTVILRHDIDFSLIPALKMAQAEEKLGAKSTYFVMVNNDYYNAMSRENRNRIKEINAMGHEIGLHWDSTIYPDDPEKMVIQFRREVGLLSDIIGKEVISASQHIPTDSPMFDVENHIENEAYSQKWRQRFSYVSDSSMAWREFTPYDLIEKGLEIHFTSHPLWWFTDGETREEKLLNSVEEQLARCRNEADSFIIYMNKILADRVRVDQEFRNKKGW